MTDTVDDEYYQTATKAEDCINCLNKSDIIALKESRQSEVVQKVLQLLCIVKGKAPTWQNARELLNPLTFKIEFSIADVTRLRSDNIVRAQEWLSLYREVLNIPYVEKAQPAAAKLLEWAINVLLLYKYKFSKTMTKYINAMEDYDEEIVSLPKVRKTAGTRVGGFDNMRLTGTKKQFDVSKQANENVQQQSKLESARKIKSECIQREDETSSTRHNPKFSKSVKRGTNNNKKAITGRYITGKTFALSNEFQARRSEIPFAILKGVGRQKAIIMKPNDDDKSIKNIRSRKDSAGLGDLLDKLAENKDVQ